MQEFNIPLLIISIVCVIVLLVIGRKRPDYVITFLLRIGLCFVAIYFLNDALLGKEISICIAYNIVTFLVCGILGFPGLFLLYGIAFWNFFVSF